MSSLAQVPVAATSSDPSVLVRDKHITLLVIIYNTTKILLFYANNNVKFVLSVYLGRPGREGGSPVGHH